MIYIKENRAIKFSHVTRGTRRGTVCEIVDLEGPNVVETVSAGETFCHVKDNFSREVGRKLSLARALKALPRTERKAYWEAYFNRNA